jgi:uncharacterized membrane protein
VTVLIAPFISRLLPLFPPVVTGTIILMTGVNLMRVGVNWAAGAAAPNLPAPKASAASPPDEVVNIVTGRCSMCHAAEPVWAGVAIAPKGVLLDTPENIARFAPAIRVRSVLTSAMPPNNVTGLEPEERRTLAEWLAKAR